MSQKNKFDFRINQEGEQWDAEITRRVSARRTTVSKQKKGFASEALAKEWAQEALAEFLENQKESNKRKSERRSTRNELAANALAAKTAAAAAFDQKQQAYFESLDDEDEYDENYDND